MANKKLSNGRVQQALKKSEVKVIVYRTIPHKPELLVFASESRALFVHKLWAAIMTAKTWREFASLVPASEWRRIKENLQEEDEDYNEEEEFRPEALPGYSDGDYPPWLQSEMSRVIPATIVEKYATRQNSILSGPFWEIPSTAEAALVEALCKYDYQVSKRMDWHFF